VTYDEDRRWLVVRRGETAVVSNLAADRQAVPVGATPDGVLLASAPGFVFAKGTVELAAESVVIIDLLA
jgi:maltooligosyltrehalose trehalohydrolase